MDFSFYKQGNNALKNYKNMDTQKTKRNWEIIYKEEIPDTAGQNIIGIISNNERCMMFHALADEEDQPVMCHIYDSMTNLMCHRNEICSFPYGIFGISNNTRFLEILDSIDIPGTEDCQYLDKKIENEIKKKAEVLFPIELRIEFLKEKVNSVYNKLTDLYAMHTSYATSLNGSIFPVVLDFLANETKDASQIINELTAFAECFLHHTDCKNSSQEEIEKFIRDNANKALQMIEKFTDEDSEELHIPQPMDNDPKWQLVESWHNGCDNGENELLYESRNKILIQMLFHELAEKIMRNGLGLEFPKGRPHMQRDSVNKITFFLGENLSSSEYWRTIQLIKQ